LSWAVRNNAQWCDLVCRSLGLGTKWEKSAWKSQSRSPRFYPDAVTLSAAVTAEELLSGIDGSPGCSVKDSFASLDLAPAGFRILFEARWIQRSPAPAPNPADAPQWCIVRTAGELRVWAAAHGGGEVFRPGLLGRDDVNVMAAHDGETLVGGAVVNRSEGVVGLSNVFATGEDRLGKVWESVVAAVSDNYPNMPIVGYESGIDRDLALNVGFVETGPLRVWVRD
jgi:hypothetical protein